MELDKRIINKCHPYDCFSNTEVVSQYSRGWFSNNLEDYTNLDSSNLVFATLTAINDTNTPYQNNKGDFKYFLPECMAKVYKVRQFRPYQSVKDLPFTVGDIMFLKDKENVNIEKCICSSITCINDSISLITLGTVAYSVQELFENYRWKFTETGDWKVFGEKECD